MPRRKDASQYIILRAFFCGDERSQLMKNVGHFIRASQHYQAQRNQVYVVSYGRNRLATL